ncbi:His/Gly/Thr/Pro-type tRNA ligase C-terminal domain-containing protein [Shewanella surugensis]|uniref:His/Gly/Thr/Pro-type tRNA ligase C-terminal domain-containing protein n=1 Tax=Shewanella surugensis TaxID=212020 RepID=A0ABT0LJ37_9GAMM|nr:His/Gly/Thr/Pro-type tRNA ligase C-terminal domain-containing protein [Shewanella surugensis]MCL1127723.1 His/Gly/Thr/Pro-type tRNA ligase C-terminal domain-containing protein [Shewanella surugensis]
MRINKKVKLFHQQKIPFIIIAGNNEVASNSLVLRTADGQQQAISLEAAITEIGHKLRK